MSAKRYVIGAPYYRKGVLYEPGSIVSIPADEKPARNWKPYEEAKAPAAAPTSPPKGKRPSDADPI